MNRPFIVFLAYLLSNVTADAVELRHIDVKVGTDGLVSTPLTVSNAGTRSLDCHADLAHWYSASLANVPARSKTVVDLWFDPTSRAYLLLNEKQENMPVESLWCGLEGRAYITRAILRLDRSQAPSAMTIACLVDNDMTVCE